MSRIMVAYGPASPWPQEENAPHQQRSNADRWAGQNGARVLLWLREGRSAMGRLIEQRTRLHQALFCIRANFADDLWLTERPSGWDTWDLALIQAVLAPRHGRLIINGDQVDLDNALQERASTRWQLLEHLDPRLERPSEHSGPDIGTHHGVDEAARLARKLTDDLNLTEAQIAQWLQEFDYTSSRGESYSPGGVHGLLDRPSAHLDVETMQMSDRGPRKVAKLLAATFGPDATNHLPQARAFNTAQADPAQYIFAITRPDDPAASMPDRPALVELLTAAPLITDVHLTTMTDLAEDPHERLFLLALLDELGVHTRVGGRPIEGWEKRDAATRCAYLDARSTIRLHAILRAHDRGTVTDPSLSSEAAFELVRDLRDQALQRTWKQAARRLNEEGIPTPSGRGHWWASSAKELLEGEGR